MDKGTSWATVYRVAKGHTQLKGLSTLACPTFPRSTTESVGKPQQGLSTELIEQGGKERTVCRTRRRVLPPQCATEQRIQIEFLGRRLSQERSNRTS